MSELTLISIDGVPGSGKSSTALWLAKMLAEKGIAALPVPENQTPHPIRFLTDLSAPLAPWDTIGAQEFSDGCLHKLRQFLQSLRTTENHPEVLVLDGFLYHTDTTSLFLMNPQRALFGQHIRALCNMVSGLRFLPILLHSDPFGTKTQAIAQKRQPGWLQTQINWKMSSPYCREEKLHGETGYFSFYRRYEEIIVNNFKEMTRDKERLVLANPEKDWSLSRREIWSFCAERVIHDGFFSDLLP